MGFSFRCPVLRFLSRGHTAWQLPLASPFFSRRGRAFSCSGRPLPSQWKSLPGNSSGGQECNFGQCCGDRRRTRLFTLSRAGVCHIPNNALLSSIPTGPGRRGNTNANLMALGSRAEFRPPISGRKTQSFLFFLTGGTKPLIQLWVRLSFFPGIPVNTGEQPQFHSPQSPIPTVSSSTHKTDAEAFPERFASPARCRYPQQKREK